MSFQPTSTGVELCNRALSHTGQGPISSLDPPTPQGTASRECARWYVPIVARLLEMHHWGLATRRLTLTETTNDRSNEWLYAFTLPGKVAYPVSIPTLTGTGSMQYYKGLGGLLASLGGRSVFLMSGRTLYSNFSGELDYVSFDITEADFTASFENVVELSLAAAICYAVSKSRPRELELRKQASSAINMAIAQNLNLGNPRYGDGPTERDFVRGDVGLMPSGLPWDWWPGPR